MFHKGAQSDPLWTAGERSTFYRQIHFHECIDQFKQDVVVFRVGLLVAVYISFTFDSIVRHPFSACCYKCSKFDISPCACPLVGKLAVPEFDYYLGRVIALYMSSTDSLTS
ncbi:hypothetical protein PS634_00735 [Pseudomonas fluorescens]|nr:hypothetical protein PS634_00735 [Pseudomonas fluorescens]